ncbi:unnamed protein product [Caenorhabditis nigoni]
MQTQEYIQSIQGDPGSCFCDSTLGFRPKGVIRTVIETFVTGKKINCINVPEETTLETMDTRLPRAQEKTTVAVGE